MDIRRKVDELHAASVLCSKLEEIQAKSASGNDSAADASRLLRLAEHLSIQELQKFERALDRAVQGTNYASQKELLSFLDSTTEDNPGEWFGRLFEVWVRSQAADSGPVVKFDFHTSRDHGRNCDIMLTMNNRRIHLEASVLTNDNKSRAAFDEWFNANGRGECDGPMVREANIYFRVWQLYQKVYDKIAKDLDPKRPQLSPEDPNILLISCSELGIRADAPGFGWALDELFCSQPRRRPRGSKAGGLDVSLPGWLDYTANRLIQDKSEELTEDLYQERCEDLLKAPRIISALMLFDGTKLVTSRANYNANKQSRLTHRVLADVEDVFTPAASWWRTP